MSGLRIGFMGTPDFALAALKALHTDGHTIVCVYSQPPRPKGRGHKLQKSPVHDFADEHSIPVFTPQTLKTEDEQKIFAAHDLDVAIVAAYGLILPEAILNAPRHGCLNIHASLLPRWRGASPIQRAIWAGDSETGITIMQMDKGLDTGPIIAMKSVPVTNDTTCGFLHDKLASLGGKMIGETLRRLEKEGALPSTPQDDTKSTYAPLLSKEDGRVDWSNNAAQIDRQIRALTPWPGVWSDLDGKRFKIRNAVLSEQKETGTPGKILNSKGDVCCGNGSVLCITAIQPPSKKPMDFSSAINGGYIAPGETFE